MHQSAAPRTPARHGAVQRRRARVARRLRLGAIAALPFAALLAGWGRDPTAQMAAGLVAGGVATMLGGAILFDQGESERATLAAVAVDLVAAAMVFGLFAGDAGTAWVLLLVPVAEAAYRGGRAAGAAVGLAAAALMLVVPVLAGEGAGSAGGVAARAGAVGLVTAVVLTLTDELAREAALTERARRDSERRADLLAVVVDAGRRLTGLDAAETLAVLATSSARLPLDGVAVASRPRHGWDVAIARGPDGSDAERLVRAAADAASAAATIVEVTPVSVGDELAAAVTAAGRVLAVPLVVHDRTEAVVVVSRASGSIPPLVVDTVQMLVGQAAVVLGHSLVLDEAERLRRQITHQAMHDPLTGLPNRAQFDERLRDRLGEDGAGMAVLFLDLDGFKAINDSMGHRAGDVLLEAAAKRLENTVRPGDTIARLGGDEFTVLLDPAESSDAARLVARRLVDVLGDPFTIDGRRCHVSASVGVAFTSDRSTEPDELLHRADAAMYRAKRAGPGLVVVDDGSIRQLGFSDTSES